MLTLRCCVQALHHAVKNEQQDVVQFLLDEVKANPDLEDEVSHTAIS